MLHSYSFVTLAGGYGNPTEADILDHMTSLGFPLRRWDDEVDGHFENWSCTWVAWLGLKPDGRPDIKYIDDLQAWWRVWMDHAFAKVCHQVQLGMLRDALSSSDHALIDEIRAWACDDGPEPVDFLWFTSRWTTHSALAGSGDAPRWAEVLASHRPEALCFMDYAEADLDLRLRTRALLAHADKSSLNHGLPDAAPSFGAHSNRL